MCPLCSVGGQSLSVGSALEGLVPVRGNTSENWRSVSQRSIKLKLVALRGSVVDGSTASETMGADLRRRPGAGRDATRGTSTASSRAPRGVAASRVKARPSGSRADRILGRRTGRPLGRRPFTTRASGAREEGVHGIQEAASADVSIIYKRFIKVRETTTIAWLLGCAAFSLSLSL